MLMIDIISNLEGTWKILNSVVFDSNVQIVLNLEIQAIDSWCPFLCKKQKHSLFKTLKMRDSSMVCSEDFQQIIHLFVASNLYR